MAYGTALLEALPSASPCLAVGDEECAFRNYATRNPDAMIMLIFLRKAVRAWRDFALAFGDVAAVYAYNRVRRMITHFMLAEFAIPTWAYYDDSALVDVAAHAHNAWFIFLKVHALLCIPIKGNPLVASSSSAPRKFFPPAGSNPYLGEAVTVSTLPCSAAPTPSRLASAAELIDTVRKCNKLSYGDASSLFSKLRCLGNELHGRVGLPALQAISAHQRRGEHALTHTFLSSLVWLEDLLEHAGPRIWPYTSGAPPALHILGDASEPDCAVPKLGAVLVVEGQRKYVFETCVPQRIIDALPRRQKRIFYYEMLWPVVAAYVWKGRLEGSHPVFYEDNEAAKFALLRGFSSDFAASALLALFWGAAATQLSRPWLTRVATGDNPADCLTKSGLARNHLADAVWESCDLEPFWDRLTDLLMKEQFPRWRHISVLFGPAFQ